MLIVDLQGVKQDDHLILSDPSIQSKKGIYGVTDRGLTGIDEFKSSHECNIICKLLNLTPFKKIEDNQNDKEKILNEADEYKKYIPKEESTEKCLIS